MNIQIFGTKKCFDTKKADRYFKERGIKFQFIDLKEKGMSKGEFTSVKQAVGGLDKLLDENNKDKNTLVLLKYLSDADKEEKLL
ncbi:MAG: ArsC family transcriptional regulator, partial [Lachnospiraceae bacterium]|nr:ArsC family transcriptional regulator [Lachnospiraceae bacterium]